MIKECSKEWLVNMDPGVMAVFLIKQKLDFYKISVIAEIENTYIVLPHIKNIYLGWEK